MANRSNTDRAFLALGALLVVLSLAAIPFGGNDSSGSQATGGGGSKMTNKVVIQDFKFMPKSVTVAAGTKVTWTNKDSAPHTATASDGKDVFTTDTVKEGQSKTVTLDKPGTYKYFCEFHAYMTATVTVK